MISPTPLAGWTLATKALFLLSFSCLSAFASPPDEIAFRHYADPVFPQPLLSTTVTRGHATVAYLVGSDGRIQDAVTVSASHPSFGQAVLEAMNQWEIEASSTVPGRRELVQVSFIREHAITSLNQREATKSLFSPSQDDLRAVRILPWTALSLPPKRTTFVAPAYPEEVRARHVQGSATVNFVIDEEGAVRVPTVTKADEEAFGRELLKAVRQWRFDPPKAEGHSVLVQVEREFSFAVR